MINHYEVPRGVAFDLDGVLADTRKAFGDSKEAGIQEVGREYSIPEMLEPRREILNESFGWGGSPLQIMEKVFERHGFPMDPILITKAFDYRTEHFHQACRNGLPMIPGAKATILGAYESELPFTITTASHETDVVLPFLEYHGLADYVSPQLIVGERAVGDRSKPHPFPYEESIRRLGFGDCPSRVMAIEDTARGIQSARGAGATAVAIATTFKMIEIDSWRGDQAPHHMVENHDALQAALFGGRTLLLPAGVQLEAVYEP